MTTLKPVLYVEDDDNDVFLMERAFKMMKVPNPLRVLTDGKMAIDYLTSVSAGVDRDTVEPCLVVLDLSMPGKNGLEVLKWIRSNPRQSDLPVLVLTSSNQESDIHRAFQLRANGFITKPGDSTKLISIVKAIKDYWLSDTKPAETFASFAEAQNVPVVSRYSNNGEDKK